MYLFLLFACVIDRTGQSATDQMRRELADHDRRVQELEIVSEDVGRRIGQLEEVTRARGKEEILKMETVEQLRQEVARIRGDFEVLQHEYGDYEAAAIGVQQDGDYRMTYVEGRVQQLEKSLGLKPPPPPARDPSTGMAMTDTPDAASGTQPVPADVPEEGGPQTPEEYFTLIEKNLAEGNGGVARAVAKRFAEQNPKSDRVPEAWYRVAESWQNEGDFKSAAASFRMVADKYPESTWAPWSILRVGECFSSLGERDTAKLFWQELVDKYPKSKAAKEAKSQLGK